MSLRFRVLLFVLFIGCAAAFVGLSGQLLPLRVASHFAADGTANGFMPRSFYLRFMLVFVIGLPALMVGLTWRALAHPRARINLPNKAHWLAPERRDRTVAVLRAAALTFGALLIAFLCYAHGLVVLANRAQPARLDTAWFVGGLWVFLAALLVWLKSLLNHFRQID